MAQAGYTPIQLYLSTTASAVPSAGNLANGELAINITDGKLFYKDNGGVVQVLATKDASSGSFTNATVSGSLTLSGGTANGVAYLNASKVLTTGSALTFDGSNLGIGGAASMYWSGANKGLAIAGSTNGAEIDLKISGGTNTSVLLQDVASNLRLGNSGNFPIIFHISDTEQMRLTSTGLGIGTSSPFTKLGVAGNAIFSGVSPYIAFAANQSGSTPGYISYTNSTNLMELLSTGDIAFETGGISTPKMRLDASGNLGLGVTPSAWTFRKAMQLGLGASIAGGASAAALVEVGANTYLNGSAQDIYIANGYATRYQQFNGNHYWQIASSGTAGNPISFTQAMTLDASGNLQIKPGNIYTDTTSGIFFSGTIGSFTNGIYGIGTNNVAINTAGSERARIDTSGNLLVGLTGSQFSSSSKLRVFNSGAIAGDFRVSGGNSIYVTTMWNDDTTGNNSFTAFATEAGGTIRGSITYNRLGGLTAYNTTSDYRAKDIIGPVINSGELIDSVPVYMGKMHGATQERPMFIAHETPVYAHTGEKDAVDADGNPVFQQMDASALIPVMWAEIQSLRKRLAAAGI